MGCMVEGSILLINSFCSYDSIPPVLLISAYFARKWYLARRLRLYGIGKGGEHPVYHCKAPVLNDYVMNAFNSQGLPNQCAAGARDARDRGAHPAG